MDEAGESRRINPQPIDPEKPFTADWQTAVSEALPILSGLPRRRAYAIREAMRILKSDSHHFSLVDMIEPKGSTEDEERRREMDSVLKGIAPNQETKPLDERRKIWLQNPEGFSEELKRDDLRRKKAEERTQRLMGRLGLDAKQILKQNLPLKDQDFKLSLRELSSLFDPISGRIIVPASYGLSNSVFSGFYDNFHKVGFFHSAEGRVELRGRTFYAAKEKGDVEVKLEGIKEDLDKVLGIVSEYAGKRAEISNVRDYLLYLGILDLMKHHSITLFHALTYNERKLEFPSDRGEFDRYQEKKLQALELMRVSVRMFYQTLFGKDYDSGVDLERIQEDLPDLVSFIQESIKESVLSEISSSPQQRSHAVNSKKEYEDKKARLDSRFRVLEVANPLMIALGAHEAVKKHPDTDMVVGIPSGGTEVAFVTQLIFELQQNHSPQLVFLPISLHSKIDKTITPVDLAAFLGEYYRDLFDSKKILLVDDNSETGDTLGLTAQALLAKKADKISVHLVDLSTKRLTRLTSPASYYHRPSVSPSTLGLTQLDERGKYAHEKQRGEDFMRARIQAQETDL